MFWHTCKWTWNSPHVPMKLWSLSLSTVRHYPGIPYTSCMSIHSVCNGVWMDHTFRVFGLLHANFLCNIGMWCSWKRHFVSNNPFRIFFLLLIDMSYYMNTYGGFPWGDALWNGKFTFSMTLNQFGINSERTILS